MKRAPICVILGRSGVGKTRLMNNFRKTLDDPKPSSKIEPLYLSQDLMEIMTNNDDGYTDIPGILFLDVPGRDEYLNYSLKMLELADIILESYPETGQGSTSDSGESSETKTIDTLANLDQLSDEEIDKMLKNEISNNEND